MILYCIALSPVLSLLAIDLLLSLPYYRTLPELDEPCGRRWSLHPPRKPLVLRSPIAHHQPRKRQASLSPACKAAVIRAKAPVGLRPPGRGRSGRSLCYPRPGIQKARKSRVMPRPSRTHAGWERSKLRPDSLSIQDTCSKCPSPSRLVSSHRVMHLDQWVLFDALNQVA